MDVKRCRRMLVIGVPGSPAPDVIKDITGSAPPTNEDGSSAGQMHEWDVQTAYYKAKVPIWIDEVADTEQWKREFLRPEAKEVIEAVGAVLYCFRVPQSGEVYAAAEQIMKAVQEISEEHADYGTDIAMLAVASPPTGTATAVLKHDGWEDVCIQHGFELIHYAAKGKNEYGEKVGFERLKEALEATDWAAADADDELDVQHLETNADEHFGGFGGEEAEMTAELFGMKAALSGADGAELELEEFLLPSQQAKQVDSLDRMMDKLLAIKEQSADLSEAQRKRMAVQVVKDLMKE